MCIHVNSSDLIHLISILTCNMNHITMSFSRWNTQCITLPRPANFSFCCLLQVHKHLESREWYRIIIIIIIIPLCTQSHALLYWRLSKKSSDLHYSTDWVPDILTTTVSQMCLWSTRTWSKTLPKWVKPVIQTRGKGYGLHSVITCSFEMSMIIWLWWSGVYIIVAILYV